jgi:hypothetical protein
MRAALVLLVGAALAFETAPEPEHKPLELRVPVQDKNFYLLSALERSPGAHDAIKSDPAMARLAAARLAAMDVAAKCDTDMECNAAAFRWSGQQMEEGGHALAALYRTSPAIRTLADDSLRATGAYVRHQDLDGSGMLERAWAECIRGINRAIDVYALGKAPRYPAIDSVMYDPKSDAYRRVIQHVSAVLRDDPPNFDLAFTASLRFALELMILNNRDEAGRLEPMEKGENAAALRRAKSIEWTRYPYTAIVVPGAGNDRPGVHLSASGKLRDEIAAKGFRDGKAPFILVSGGFVHPNQTEFAEAIEMKRDLMARFGIPEDAIIVDPHARHTTTNMRNAARLLYRYAIPFERKALVSSDPGQSQYIENPLFAKRCTDELGYVPFRLLARTSPFDLEFLPARESLHIDPQDPLDP